MTTARLAALVMACALVGASPSARADGQDFIDDARLLYRIAACGGSEPVAPAIEKIVARHCKVIEERLAEFRASYFEANRGWFQQVVPVDVPRTVVYPFGGGDLLSALVAFPEATDITTLSLEHGGDPRRLAGLTPKQLEQSLAGLRAEIGGLISVGSNTTENLSAGQHNELPAQVSSFLLGLVAGGYEPLSMRFFRFDDAGAIVYLEKAEIEAQDQASAAKLRRLKKAREKAIEEGDVTESGAPKHDWQSPNFSLAFSNVEIRFRRKGETGDGAVRTHRHVAWNLSDGYLKTHPQVLRFLESKGKVSALVKGASYLLWRPHFSRVRGYLLDHLAWMLSDSTGVPPAYAGAAGMVQETYGSYTGAFLPDVQGSKHDEAFIELWKQQKRRRLGFRFGYVDMNKRAHLVVTRPRPRP